MVADLALLGLGIALQPFRLSAFIMILATKGGTRKGLGFVFGWLACLVLVIAVVVLITAEAPADPHNLADQARHDVTMDRCGDSRHGSAMDTGGGRCHHRGPGQALHRRGLHCAGLVLPAGNVELRSAGTVLNTRTRGRQYPARGVADLAGHSWEQGDHRRVRSSGALAHRPEHLRPHHSLTTLRQQPPRTLAPGAGHGCGGLSCLWSVLMLVVYASDWRSAITRLTAARNAGPSRVPSV